MGTQGTDKKRAAFLEALTETGAVTRACAAAGVPRRTVYKWRAADSDFAIAWDEAYEAGVEELEAEAKRRAYAGVDKPIYQQGRMVGTVREYSDTLLMFLLKGAKPERYRENATVKHEFASLTDEELIERAKSVISGDGTPGTAGTKAS